ncbi:GWxTD domain-containing protein [bacterium]|nr:GWxTD domain-containing protein [bacterium]
MSLRIAPGLSGALLALLLAGCAGGGAPRPTVNLEGVTPAAEGWSDEEMDHLRYVLNDQQQTEFLELPESERPEFMRVVWASLDPTPTTERNERREAHYVRLTVARTRFGREKAPGWDTRGELLLRYGPPDERQVTPGDVVPGLGLVAPNEVWVYRWLGSAFRLEDPRFQGDFVDAISNRRTNRKDLLRDTDRTRDQSDPSAHDAEVLGAQDIDTLGADAEAAPAFDTGKFKVVDAEKQVAQERLQALLARGQESLEKRPRAFLVEQAGGKLDYFFDVQCFSDRGSGQTRVEVNTAFWAQNLRFVPEGDAFAAILDTEAALKTRDYHPVARARKSTRSRRTSLSNLKGQLILDQIALVVEPGDYRLALSVQDSVSGSTGVFQTDAAIPAYFPGDFAISDVQLALSVKSASEAPDGLFVKGNLQVVPYPLGTFPKDRDIYVYFEVYGLELSETGDALYTVQFKIQPRATTTASWFGSSKGRVTPGVATAYTGSSTVPNVQEYFSLEPSTFTEDVYDVEIQVTDLVSDRVTKRSASFAVQK